MKSMCLMKWWVSVFALPAVVMEVSVADAAVPCVPTLGIGILVLGLRFDIIAVSMQGEWEFGGQGAWVAVWIIRLASLIMVSMC